MKHLSAGSGSTTFVQVLEVVRGTERGQKSEGRGIVVLVAFGDGPLGQPPCMCRLLIENGSPMAARATYESTTTRLFE